MTNLNKELDTNINERINAVAKFGGTSLACSAQIKRVHNIITENNLRFIVPSAPGKRSDDDIKVTDLLIKLCGQLTGDAPRGLIDETLLSITERFTEIALLTGCDLDIGEYVLSLPDGFLKWGTPYIISRGEYLMGRLLATYLGYEFIDAADIIFFDDYGRLLIKKTLRAAHKRLADSSGAVIPGFYGSTLTNGRVTTFSRGGSDVTGAIIARAVNALEYQNWTDVSGFLAADPRIVKNPLKVARLDFNELRELSCMGAGVLHGDTVLPLIGSDIPIHVKNTNSPEDYGTVIFPGKIPNGGHIAGIAGKCGYTSVAIKKLELGADSSFVRRALHAFEACSVPVEHMPLGMDNLSIITFTDALSNKRDMLINELNTLLGDVDVEFTDSLGLIAAVSSSLSSTPDFARVIFNALSRENINIRLTDHGSGSKSYVVGIDEAYFERAVNVMYDEFLRHNYI